MLRAAHDLTSIIYPMISSVDEVNRVEVMKNEVEAELRDEGIELPDVRFGIMIETPAVAERFDDYARRFDTFNLGANDLTQYTLAADRTNPQVSDYYNQMHPSVLSMVARVAEHAHRLGRHLCYCGESASDTRYLPLLVGLGIRSLSVSPSMIPILKQRVTHLDLAQCRKLAGACSESRNGRTGSRRSRPGTLNVMSLQLKRHIGLPLLILYGLGTVVGVGIYAVVGEIASGAGVWTPLSFLIAAIIATFTAFSLAELSARYPESAGEAAYVTHGFGSSRLAMITGLLVILSGVVSAATVIRGAAAYVQDFLVVPDPVVIIGLAVILGTVASLGVRESAGVAATISVIEIIGSPARDRLRLEPCR